MEVEPINTVARIFQAMKSAEESAIAPGGVGRVRQTETTPPLTSRERFLRACRCKSVDHPPVWLMRQAGRVLPEYRSLKEKYSFLQLVQTPELAAEVTLQPIRRFGFDAAIIFSDILVVPEAMGQGYAFRDSGGIQMAHALRSSQDIRKLDATQITDKLQYVAETIRLVKSELNGRNALLGFAGSPWTLASFMLEGGSTPRPTKALDFFRNRRADFETLCGKITDGVIGFLRMQIKAGVDAIQIFDSLGGVIPPCDFEAASGSWMREIIAALANQSPVIVFSKGTIDWHTLLRTEADVISAGPEACLVELRRLFPVHIGIQGNLRPEYLVNLSPHEVEVATSRILSQMRGRAGFIFNLGHGVPPQARLENIETLVRTVRSFK